MIYVSECWCACVGGYEGSECECEWGVSASASMNVSVSVRVCLFVPPFLRVMADSCTNRVEDLADVVVAGTVKYC